jgi:maleylacetate reductase
MEVRWGLPALPGLLAELSLNRPLLVASERWRAEDLPVDIAGEWREVPSDRIGAAAEAARDADVLVPVGGGSTIDLAKAISAETELLVVSVPTTYSGSEWAPWFGIRDPQRRAKGGGGGAHLAGIVYEPALTLGLPRGETVGSALNALAHTAEAPYVDRGNAVVEGEALAGAALIADALPRVVEDRENLEARTQLLEGAMHAGAALGSAGMGLAHAMAQALGGRYGLPHGAMNAIALPPALRFNEPVAADEIARFGEAMGTDDPISHAEELAALGGFRRLRDFGVPETELAEVAEAAAVRPAARANPRPASPAQIEELLRSVY